MGIVTDGLVAEYVIRLAKGGTAPGNNSDPTTTLHDLVGGHHGTLGTFAWNASSGYAGSGTAADPYRLVMNGDGTDNVSAALDVVKDAGTKGFTFEARMYVPASAPAGVQMAVCQMDNVSSPYQTAWLGFYSGHSSAVLYYRPANGSAAIADGPTLTWGSGLHDIAGTFENATNGMKVYVDGSNSGATNRTPATPTNVDSYDLSLGGLHDGSDWSYPYTGAFVAVRIYDRPLTAAEVEQNYNAGVLAASVDSAARPFVADLCGGLDDYMTGGAS